MGRPRSYNPSEDALRNRLYEAKRKKDPERYRLRLETVKLQARARRAKYKLIAKALPRISDMDLDTRCLSMLQQEGFR